MSDSITPPLETLAERILAPYSIEEFYNEYLGKKQLHIARDDPRYWDFVCREQELFDAIRSGEMFPPYLEMRRHHLPLDTRTLLNAEGRFDLDAIEKELANGAMLRLPGLDAWYARPRQALRDLAIALGAENSWASSFYTKTQVVGQSNKHFDPADGFTLQIAGEKTWYIYDSPETALTKRAWIKDEFQPGEQIASYSLKPGDLLYNPRGFFHATDTGGNSLHLSLTMDFMTPADLIREMVSPLADSEIEFRRKLPKGYMEDPTIIAPQVTALLRALTQSWQALAPTVHYTIGPVPKNTKTQSKQGYT